MVVQCPGCKTLFDLRTFVADGGILVFTCASCQRQQALTSEAPGTGAAPTLLPTQPTPAAAGVALPVPRASELPAPPSAAETAGAPQARGEALVAPRPAGVPAPLPEGAVAPAAAEVAGPQATFWVQWNRVALDWGNVKAHEQFVSYCAGMRSLPFAGTRYREHLEANPQDPMAKKGRDRVLTQAMVLATAEKENQPKSLVLSAPNKNTIYAITVVMVAGLGWMVLRVITAITGVSE